MDLPLLANSRQINTPDGKMLAKTITVDGKEYKRTFVCMWNPHLVVFIDDIKDVNLPAIGPKLENHPLFPERTNVEFVEVLSHNKHKPLQEQQIHTRYNKLTIMN